MKDCLGVARKSLTELDATARGDQTSKQIAPILERHVTQFITIEVQEIEGDEIEVVLAPGDRLAQFRVIRQAGLIEDYDLALDDCVLDSSVLAAAARSRYNAPGEDANAAGVYDDLRT
jgi:hypothetical protein